MEIIHIILLINYPTCFFYTPDIPLIPIEKIPDLHKPPTLEEHITKLQQLEKQERPKIDQALLIRNNLHHITMEAHSGAITTSHIATELDKPCSAGNTFLSLWKLVPCTPHWSSLDPIVWIKHALNSWTVF